MATFTGNNIKDTYFSILNLGTASGVTLTPTKTIVTDGIGQNSAMKIGSEGNGITICGGIEVCSSSSLQACINTSGGLQATSICSTGGLNVTGSTCTGGDLNVCGTSTLGDYSGGDQINLKGDTNIGDSSNACCLVVRGPIKSYSDIIAFHSSDERLKDDINKIETPKDILNGLNGYSFNWKEEADREGKDFGVIAQEVQEVLPEIVHKRDDGYLAVDYIKLIPVLIEEVKRLSKEVDELKNA